MKKFRCKFCKNKKLNFLEYKPSGEIIKYCKNCNVKYYIDNNTKNNSYIYEINYFIEVDNIDYIVSIYYSYFKENIISNTICYVDNTEYDKKGFIINNYPYNYPYNSIYIASNFNMFKDNKYHPNDVKKSLIKTLKLINLI